MRCKSRPIGPATGSAPCASRRRDRRWDPVHPPAAGTAAYSSELTGPFGKGSGWRSCPTRPTSPSRRIGCARCCQAAGTRPMRRAVHGRDAGPAPVRRRRRNPRVASPTRGITRTNVKAPHQKAPKKTRCGCFPAVFRPMPNDRARSADNTTTSRLPRNRHPPARCAKTARDRGKRACGETKPIRRYRIRIRSHRTVTVSRFIGP